MNPKITDWRDQRVWLVGASSGIGAEVARQLASTGARVAATGRSAEKLKALAVYGILPLPCDATDEKKLGQARARLIEQWGGIDLVIYLAGDYVPMRADSFDLAIAEKVVDINFSAAMRLLAAVLPDLHAGGGIAFVASVAGYRGLPKALAYGPGKAALIHLAESLYLDLAPKGVGVWVINPGFVRTQLTAKNDFEMPALMTPEAAATALIKGFRQGCFEIHFPKRFTRVMKLLALLPYRWYFPLVRRLTGA